MNEKPKFQSSFVQMMLSSSQQPEEPQVRPHTYPTQQAERTISSSHKSHQCSNSSQQQIGDAAWEKSQNIIDFLTQSGPYPMETKFSNLSMPNPMPQISSPQKLDTFNKNFPGFDAETAQIFNCLSSISNSGSFNLSNSSSSGISVCSTSTNIFNGSSSFPYSQNSAFSKPDASQRKFQPNAITHEESILQNQVPLHNFAATTPAFQLEETEQINSKSPAFSQGSSGSSSSINSYSKYNAGSSEYNQKKSFLMQNGLSGESLNDHINNSLLRDYGRHSWNLETSSSLRNNSGGPGSLYTSDITRLSKPDNNSILKEGESSLNLNSLNGKVYPQSQLQNANKFFMCKLIAHLINTLSRIKDEEQILQYVNQIQQSGRIQNKGQVDLYTLTHFRLIFFLLTRDNIKQLNQHDLALHEQVFSEIINGNQISENNIQLINNIQSSLIPLCKEYFRENDDLQKCILRKQWAKQSMAEGYMEWTRRIIKGIEKMSEGTYILRF